MDDDADWKIKKTSVERDNFGSGRGGGPPMRTAVGAAGSGGSSDNTAFCKRLAIHHSDPAVVFALQILLQPFVDQGSIELRDVSNINLNNRWFDVNNAIFDLIVSEITESNVGIYREYKSGQRTNRIIVLGSTSLITQYLIRLVYAEISVCPIQFGFDPLLYCVQEYLRQPKRNLMVAPQVQDHFFAQTMRDLSPRQRNWMRRLSWPQEILQKEFGVLEQKFSQEQQQLLEILEVANVDEAKNFVT